MIPTAVPTEHARAPTTRMSARDRALRPQTDYRSTGTLECVVITDLVVPVPVFSSKEVPCLSEPLHVGTCQF